MSNRDKYQQRLDWVRFRLTALDWAPEEIELELLYIREKRFDMIEPCTKTLLDFETFKILSE